MTYLELVEQQLNMGFPMDVAQARAKQRIADQKARNYFLDTYMPTTFGVTLAEYEQALKDSNNRCSCCKNSGNQFSPRIPFHPVKTPTLKIAVLCKKCKPLVQRFNDFFNTYYSFPFEPGTNLASETK